MKLLITILFFFTLVVTITDVKAETNTVSSTVVTNSTPPTANAPTIMNNNSDICKLGIGASVQNNVLGLASGYVVTDEFCETLRASRAMYQYGMKVAAVALLCQDPRVWDSMLDAGTPCPAEGLIGTEAANYWKENPSKIPVGSKFRDDYTIVVKDETQQGDFDALKNFGLMALTLLFIL